MAFTERDRFADPIENALRYGGIALALAGVALVAVWLMAPPRRHRARGDGA